MSMTPEEIKERRKNAAQRLAVGSAMLGGAAVAQHEVKSRTGIKGPIHALKDINRGGVKPKHGKFAAGWLATRGVAAAGLPLAVSGTSNLLAKRPKTEEGVDIKRDVIGGSVDRVTPDIPKLQPPKRKRPLKEQATAAAPIVGGAALGGFGGRKLASQISRNKGSKARIAAMGIGAGLGSAFGASAAVPVARHATDVASSGRYKYHPSTGIKRREIHKAIPGAIVELPKTEQQTLIRQKKKQSKYSLASAGLGLTAFGLKSPSLAAAAAKRSKRLSAMKPVQRFAGTAPKADKYATNLGIAALGVGGMGSLNFARIQRAETKADQRATGVKKAEKPALKEVRDREWKSRPRQSGPRRQGRFLAMNDPSPITNVWHTGTRKNGVKQVAGTDEIQRDYRSGKQDRIIGDRADYDRYRAEAARAYSRSQPKPLEGVEPIKPKRRTQANYDLAKALVNFEKREYKRERNGRFSSSLDPELAAEVRGVQATLAPTNRKLVQDKQFNRHLNFHLDNAIERGKKNGWSTDETFQHFVGNIHPKSLNEMANRRHKRDSFFEPGWPEDMPWSESVGDTEGSEQSYRAIADELGDYSSYLPEHRPKGWKPKAERVEKRVLVTGSRDWDDEAAVHGHLDRLAGEHPDIEVIEGGARGADTHARNWAAKRGKKVSTFEADWKAHGRAAGPKRNQRMLDEAKPDRVIAFSRDLENSKGTRDMVRRAKRANVPTEVYGAELAKALFPTKLFRPRSAGFAGVKPSHLRTVQTPTGYKQIRVRGSVG